MRLQDSYMRDLTFRFVPLLMLLAITTAMSGCATYPRSVVYKAGSSAAQRQAAVDRCTIRSFKEIPQTMRTTVYGGYGPYYGGPIQSTSYDVNRDLRRRYVERCLRARGYAIIERPSCTTPEDRAEARRAEQRQPAANQISCVTGKSLLRVN